MPRPLIGITTHRRDSDEGKKDVLGLMVYYVDSVRRNGGLPVMIPLGLDESELRELFERLDGLLISGGGDIDPGLLGVEKHETMYGIDSDRDRAEFNLIRWAIEEDKPFLGICRGIQVFNVALGGTLHVDIAPAAPGHPLKHNWFPGYPRDKIAHTVSVAEGTRLAGVLGSPVVEVNSLHHQAVNEVAPGLHVAARAPDGIIEAVELRAHKFAVGVQWHPECLQDRPEMRRLFAELIEAANL